MRYDRDKLNKIKEWSTRQWTVFKPWFLKHWRALSAWVTRCWRVYSAPDNRWLTVPCTVAALLVLLVLVKSCQGIIYYNSNECKVYRLGYPIDEARAIVGVLSNEQIDSLVVRQEHDTIAYPLLDERYFIAKNFDRYLAFHKVKTEAPLTDVVAIVNVKGDLDRVESATPCDTSKGYLMLINGRHYLDKDYKPANLVPFEKTYTYEHNRANSAVVDAFMALQRDCKKQTGAQLMVNSAYRSYEQQIDTYKRNEKGYAALAGYSEHQTGLAIDVTSLQHPMRWPFDKSKEGIWMREHCHEYGFILRYPERQSHIFGFAYEPWHLRYVGTETARKVHDEDITFDEYYAFYIEGTDDKPLKR